MIPPSTARPSILGPAALGWRLDGCPQLVGDELLAHGQGCR
jgi:hypothetical protein